ncbi:MAG: acetate--CoA ligase family protein [Pelistega sp.]|nr:acetate--CoA ligase family protein [Pelistega sp.]
MKNLQFKSLNTTTFNKALLNPSSIALVGASGNIKKNTARPLRFMQKHGFKGDIYPVNPGSPQVMGLDAYPSVKSLPDHVEHAFIMIDSASVLEAVEQCAEKGIPVATIYSDGFAESGEEGVIKQQRLLERAKQLGVRLLGPNSIGAANVDSGAIMSVNAVFEMEHLIPGDISFISQSGSMMGSLMSRAMSRGYGFSKTISVGNESDVSVGELLDALVDDESTKVILLFLETLRDIEKLNYALARARAVGKPVIAYKLGRSKQGDALSQSHTGAIAGNNAAVDAYFHAQGVMRVDCLETLFEIAPLVSRYASLRPLAYLNRPVRVAVITTTGGGAATVVDNLGLSGMEAVVPPTEFIAHMAQRGVTIRQTPVIDLTLAATSEQYQTLLHELLQADWCDVVLSVVGSSAQFHPQLAIKPILDTFAQGKADAKPLVTFLAPDAPESLQLLQEANIAAFRTPESCADALAAFFKPMISRDQTEYKPIELPESFPRTGNLTELESTALFADLGISHAQNAVVQVNDLRHEIAYPIVLKVLSRDILHKTDVGGVQVGIQSDEELAEAVKQMAALVAQNVPQAKIDGFLIQAMEGRLIELMLGYRHDPLVGPTIVLSAGGITAELNPDFAIRMAPVSLAEANAMIEEVHYTKLIRGYRNLPFGDSKGLAEAIVRFSQLALVQAEISEAEINPLFIQQDRVVAVDGVVRLTESSAN